MSDIKIVVSDEYGDINRVAVHKYGDFYHVRIGHENKWPHISLGSSTVNNKFPSRFFGFCRETKDGNFDRHCSVELYSEIEDITRCLIYESCGAYGIDLFLVSPDVFLLKKLTTIATWENERRISPNEL